MTTTWTPERIETLTELWNLGMEANEIGVDLGLSKGAVIGKAWRMKLPARASRGRPYGPRRLKARDAPKQPPAVVAAPGHELLYHLLVEAAERGLVCPTNMELSNQLGQASISGPTKGLMKLEKLGLIEVERFHAARVVTITATGKQTGKPKNRLCLRRATGPNGEFLPRRRDGPRKPHPAEHLPELVAQIMELTREQHTYKSIGDRLGLTKAQVTGIVSRNRNRSESEAEAAGGGVRRRWHVSQAQARADQKIRGENGQELLPWAMTRAFLSVRGMRFATCQWIAGQPIADDACKCGRPTVGGLYCAEHKAHARGQRQPGKAA